MRKTYSIGSRQNGAVLYVALILLILLSLLGLAGMQVSSMQERMASNYRQANLAFQNAEAELRKIEAEIKSQGASYQVTNQLGCDFNSIQWARAVIANKDWVSTRSYVRRLNCDLSEGSSSNLGGTITSGQSGGFTNATYEITVLGLDDLSSGKDDAPAIAVVQSVYIP